MPITGTFSRAGKVREFPQEPLRDDEHPEVYTGEVPAGQFLATHATEYLITQNGKKLLITA